MRDLECEKNNVGYNEQYPNGDGTKCKNYIICKEVLPNWWYDCKGHYICTNCDCMFGEWINGKGVLDINNNTECPICLEINDCVKQAFCNHKLCIKCFKRCYYGDEMLESMPIFPYPEIEDEYFNDENNEKWINEFPLIKKYNEKYDLWLDMKEEKYNNDKNLRKCPICRK